MRDNFKMGLGWRGRPRSRSDPGAGGEGSGLLIDAVGERGESGVPNVLLLQLVVVERRRGDVWLWG